MAPRLNKRQLREQEELDALQEAADDNHSDSETSSPPAPSKPLAGGFAALMDTRGDEEESEEESMAQTHSSKSKKARELQSSKPLTISSSDSQQKKKKKKVVAVSPPISSSAPQNITPKPETVSIVSTGTSTPSGPSKKEKKALKKQKEKQKDETDDFDKALAELSVKYPDLKQQLTTKPALSSPATARSLATLLSVSLSHLDSEAELRKFFGSKVISSVKGSSSSSSSRQSAAQRSNLTRPQSTWAPAQFREGLSVRSLTPEEVDESLHRHLRQPLHGEKLWTVEYSKKYRSVTLAFMKTVLSGDPEGFWMTVREFPYHADTLLQLSEVYHHREEHSTAADFVDRSLFAYERAFVGAFNFTSGADRLDFDRVENRPFFLALHRQITDLQRRGCVRTSFEFARLLYALDPWTDPHGSLLHLDYLALKAGMNKWLIDLWDLFEPEVEKEASGSQTAPYFRRILPNVLPGITYSRALALFISEEESGEVHERSTRALEHAIRSFPSIVPLLADKADISLGGEIRGHSAFRIQTDKSWLMSDSQSILHLLSHLYAQRSSSFWKAPTRAAWFTKAVSAVHPSLPNSSPAPPRSFSTRFDSPSLAHSIYRHVLVNEPTCRSLFPFVPRTILDTRHLACDPLPPPTRSTEYDSTFFRGVEADTHVVRPRTRRQEARLLEQLVPDAAFRAQLVGFWDAHPAVRDRFPGGVAQFVELAGHMPEDALEDMFIALAEMVHQQDENGEMVMPGGMPGGEVMVNFVEPGDLEDVPDLEHAEALPARQAHDDEDEEETDDDDGDDEEHEVAALPVRIFRSVFNRFWGGSAGNNANEESSDEEVAQLRDTGGVD